MIISGSILTGINRSLRKCRCCKILVFRKVGILAKVGQVFSGYFLGILESFKKVGILRCFFWVFRDVFFGYFAMYFLGIFWVFWKARTFGYFAMFFLGISRCIFWVFCLGILKLGIFGYFVFGKSTTSIFSILRISCKFSIPITRTNVAAVREEKRWNCE